MVVLIAIALLAGLVSIPFWIAAVMMWLGWEASKQEGAKAAHPGVAAFEAVTGRSVLISGEEIVEGGGSSGHDGGRLNCIGPRRECGGGRAACCLCRQVGRLAGQRPNHEPSACHEGLHDEPLFPPPPNARGGGTLPGADWHRPGGACAHQRRGADLPWTGKG